MLLYLLVCALTVLAEEEGTHINSGLQNGQISPAELIPCENKWYFYKDKCYMARGKEKSTRLNWDAATARCKSLGGTLATIYSKEMEDFIITYLLHDIKTHAWIGIHDHEKEGEYVWQDGSTSAYRNWEPDEPSGAHLEHEDCIEMMFIARRGGGGTGQWNDYDCPRDLGYICQTDKSSKKSPDPRYCKGGGWKHEESCYHLVEQRKSWTDAESYCQENFDGHLVMVADFTVEFFLNYILSSFKEEMWIGIKIEGKSNQKWTSGWHVAYNNWSKDMRDFVDGTCVKRSKTGQWLTSPCANKYSFICEKSYGAGPPVVTATPVDAPCPMEPGGWLDLDGEYCYFFENVNTVNWYKALFECKRRGGSLAKIRSQEEDNLLRPFLKYKQHLIYIGLYRLLNTNKEPENVFVWTDGSRLDWTNWDSGEPNKEDEKCVALDKETLKWNDYPCDFTGGYICSVRKVSPSRNETNIIIWNSSNGSCKIPNGVWIIMAVCVLVIICVAVGCRRLPPQKKRKQNSSLVHFQPPVPSSPRPRYGESSPVFIIGDDRHYEDMG